MTASQGFYNEYLKLSQLHDGRGILECQVTKLERPKTDDEKVGKVARNYNNEHLFIITHQAFELWFKQIVEELEFLIRFFKKLDSPDDGQPACVLVSDGNNSLNRINKILKVVVQHFEILETMPPGGFLEFRHHLKKGSGFQSLQFREIEIKLGVEKDKRLQKEGLDYRQDFTEEEKGSLATMESEENLIGAVEVWLKRVYKKHPKFWAAYTAKCTQFDEENPREDNTKTLDGLKNETEYKGNNEENNRRLSYDAFSGALLISLYKDESDFQQRYQLLYQLMDLDALVSRWRSIHVLMVHRMIGSKKGTGGSSGVRYLTDTTRTDAYRVFRDLFDLSTFFIRSGDLPAYQNIVTK